MLAELIGIPCEVVAIDEMEEDPAFSRNQPDRCYTCRRSATALRKAWPAGRASPSSLTA